MYFLIGTIVISVITYLLIKIHNQYYYFKKHGIPGPREWPIVGIFGSQSSKLKQMSTFVKDLYEENKEAKYVGFHMFFNPIVVVNDCSLTKSILVKNFDHFSNRKEFFDAATNPLMANTMINSNGEKWHNLRHLMSPSFTSSKMKILFELMTRCAEKFVIQFLDMYENVECIEMKDIFTKYTTDVIASCVFGFELNTLKDPDNEFYVRGRTSTNLQTKSLPHMILNMSIPKFLKKRGMSKEVREDTDFFVNVMSSTVRTREEQGIVRPDFVQLMMEGRKKIKHLDILEMASQAFTFFIGGLETVSSLLCMVAYEVATNPEVQVKLQTEIDAMMEDSDGKPGYDQVNNLPYLDAVLSESLRMHPLPRVSRVCTKEFALPPAVPGGSQFLVEPGVEVWIPVAGIHRDPSYFENPDKFDPDRFLREPGKKASSTDVTSLGFGLGPRMCIGNRFAVMEIKILFVQLLSKCSLATCEKTCSPLEYSPRSFQPSVKGGCWLKIKPRNL